MKSQTLGVLGAFAILSLFAQGATERTAPRQHRPISDRRVHGDGTTSSSNWSGYAVTGSAFTSARGSWIVPAAACTSGHKYASFWVGLDGYTSSTVEQTGTDSDCVGSSPLYYAWYEFYPQPSIQITSLTIKPGDRMSAQVVYSAGKFTVKITDETTGKSFTKSATVSGAQRSSAEWIAEAPSSFSVLPLANFGTILFGTDSTGLASTCFAHDSTTSGPIGAFSTIEAITMEKNNIQESIPSALSSDGTSFSATWAAQ